VRAAGAAQGAIDFTLTATAAVRISGAAAGVFTVTGTASGGNIVPLSTRFAYPGEPANGGTLAESARDGTLAASARSGILADSLRDGLIINN
jgi:hypothetical protein